VILETRDHGRDERMACYGRQDIALVPDVLDLLEADHCGRKSSAYICALTEKFQSPGYNDIWGMEK